MIQVGQKVRFDPYVGVKVPSFGNVSSLKVGTVIEVHEDHHWFAVEYDVNDSTMRTSFNFADIGDNVQVVR